MLATLLANKTQHCWAQHVASVCTPCCVLLRVVATCWSLKLVKLHPTTSNKSQQHATTHNMVCKRSQHVGTNNVASCRPTMLRAFARAFRVIFIELCPIVRVKFPKSGIPYLEAKILNSIFWNA